MLCLHVTDMFYVCVCISEIPTASLSKSPSSDSSSTGSQTQSVTHQQYNSPIGLYAKHSPQNSLDGQQRLNPDIG